MTTLLPDSRTLSSSEEPVRLSIRHPVSSRGFIDGGWWPHTRDLAVEVPPLLALLWAQDRRMTRVSYNFDAWQPAPSRLRVHGHVVHLGGFHHHDPLVLSLVDPRGIDRMDLLVIPPETPQYEAEAALTAAGLQGGTDTARQMLESATGIG